MQQPKGAARAADIRAEIKARFVQRATQLAHEVEWLEQGVVQLAHEVEWLEQGVVQLAHEVG